jgi:N-formylglutamate amidohydrolase
MSLPPYCIFRRWRSPIVAAAIHHGHATRPEVSALLAIDECKQMQEEDPFTGEWAQVVGTQIIGLRSRFEIDLNRPREKAVYQRPEDAWGLHVWREPPPAELVAESLREYDAFYTAIESLLHELVKEYGKVVVYDLHTYNHRRDGRDSTPADSEANPEVNIGTGTMDRSYWAPVVERLMSDLIAYNFDGRSLDVRENVKFRGGEFGRWIHTTFPRQVCSIAIEFKKFFMDEWSGEADLDEVERIYRALQSTVPGVARELELL